MLDSHIHLDFYDEGEREALVSEAHAAGVTGFVVPSAHPRDWDRVARLAAEESDVFVAFGIHPWFAGEVSDLGTTVSELRKRLSGERVVAVGECGLDRGRSDAVPLSRQIAVFEAQLSVAQERELPVVVHSVRTESEVVAAFRRAGVRRGLLHGFAGDSAAAARLLDAGFTLGIGPRALRSARTRDALRTLPLERLLVETDAPDTTFRGSARGLPADLLRVVREITEIRTEPETRVREVLARSVEEFWGRATSATGDGIACRQGASSAPR